jgi:dsRNA-specific ribonuclease
MNKTTNREKEHTEHEIKDPTPYILNEKNILITKEYIESVMKKYSVDCTITDLSIFQTAMTHPSYLIRDDNYYKNTKAKKNSIDMDPIADASTAIPLQKRSYERLEFLGDSVIHLILAHYFYARYENENEGFMTRLRTKIENGETLSQLSIAIGLNKYVLISRYIEKNGGRENNTSILEDSFEAFMGALYLTIGFDKCRAFLFNIMEEEVDFAKVLHTETNYKDMLLQYFHQRKWKDPIYGVLDVSGPENKKNFTMYVKCQKTSNDLSGGDVIASSVGTSKQAASQAVARQSLIHFGVLKEEDSDDEIVEYFSEDDD